MYVVTAVIIDHNIFGTVHLSGHPRIPLWGFCLHADTQQ